MNVKNLEGRSGYVLRGLTRALKSDMIGLWVGVRVVNGSGFINPLALPTLVQIQPCPLWVNNSVR